MSWTRAADLTAQIQKLWDRGNLLRYRLQPNELFPLRLKLKTPSSIELSERFDEVRQWIAHLNALPNYRIESRQFTHRVLGKNSVPHAIWVDDLQNALTIVDKHHELDCFEDLVGRAMAHLPELLSWMHANPLRALNYRFDWDHLLATAEWVKRHPRSGLYLRQADIPGVHSKFIESHSGVLSEWFDLVLPADQINQELSVCTQFAERYGFRAKPTHIRFRLLDPKLWSAMHCNCADIALDSATFAMLDFNPRFIFITENEVNFLAFPKVPSSLVIFGKGYGWEALSHAKWMEKSQIVYWGDIDTHGFAILDQLRHQFENVTSVLMDRATLMQHRHCWVEEEQQATQILARLTPEETELYDQLRRNEIRRNLRFEQERIGIDALYRELKKLMP